MTSEPAGADRCPKCGAAVRLGDPWCTLCYADLRPPPPPDPDPDPEPEPDPEPPPVDALTAPLGPDGGVLTVPPESPAPSAGEVATEPPAVPTGGVAGPSWPCSACGMVNPMAQDACSACGVHFLAGLREQDGPLLELPVVGDITKLSRGQRFGLAGAVILAVVLLTLLLGLIFA